MNKRNDRRKKTMQELSKYKNMVNYKTDVEDTDNSKLYIEDLQGTKDIIDDIDGRVTNEEMKVEKPPLAYRAKEFFESYFTQLLIGALIALAGWNIGLQRGQDVQSNKLQNMEQDINEIKILIEEKYIRKDIYDIQLESIKEKIEDIEEEMKELKN